LASLLYDVNPTGPLTFATVLVLATTLRDDQQAASKPLQQPWG